MDNVFEHASPHCACGLTEANEVFVDPICLSRNGFWTTLRNGQLDKVVEDQKLVILKLNEENASLRDEGVRLAQEITDLRALCSSPWRNVLNFIDAMRRDKDGQIEKLKVDVETLNRENAQHAAIRRDKDEQILRLTNDIRVFRNLSEQQQLTITDLNKKHEFQRDVRAPLDNIIAGLRYLQEAYGLPRDEEDKPRGNDPK